MPPPAASPARIRTVPAARRQHPPAQAPGRRTTRRRQARRTAMQFPDASFALGLVAVARAFSYSSSV